MAPITQTTIRKLHALTFADGSDYDKVREGDRIDISVSMLSPGTPLVVTLQHTDGTVEEFRVNHTYNDKQILWFKSGSALNSLTAK